MPFKKAVPFEKNSEVIDNKIIILDIDGTIVSDGEDVCQPEVRERIQKLARTNSIFLNSNSGDQNRTKKLAESLGVLPLVTKYHKPNPKILFAIGRSAEDCVIIGDKYLTDYWLAKRTGARFIPVARKYSGREIIKVRIIYFFDDIFNFLFY